ncbi:hypothetical protein SAMN05421690_101018 [Nitrosomonas sp. Nm51]|uniref:hypothetical protein n=1 Tax=Nitrosomonas sp. Nm51 TaxID=133720 RepID=UPI0008CA07A2|nr:hypothetical protein [Nitrosomonas sp. Nm51]SER15130.1 hypothetical protein SAMN05421690_101018 [Nitrosomonas sp. Nm51]
MKKVLVIMLGLAAFAVQANDPDKRQILAVNELQRAHILEEMRTLLMGTQKILFSLSEENMAAVAQHARLLGTDMAHKAEGHLSEVLPKEFMQLGMSVHRDFDQIAKDAELLQDVKHTLRQLSESMNKCVACHATYQIQTTQSSGKRDQKTDL